MAGFGWLSRTVTGVTTRAEDSSAMCLFAALGLLAPRLILVLMWLFNSSFVLQPFAGMAVPNPVLPIAGPGSFTPLTGPAKGLG